MVYKELKKSVEEIKMSEETKKRIIRNCYLQISNEEEYSMKKLLSFTLSCAISSSCSNSARLSAPVEHPTRLNAHNNVTIPLKNFLILISS